LQDAATLHVLSTYKNLLWWTVNKGQTSEESEVKAYSKTLWKFLIHYQEVLVSCKAGIPKHPNPQEEIDYRAAVDIIFSLLNEPAEIALFRHHLRAVSKWKSLYEFWINQVVYPAPIPDADWVLGPDYIENIRTGEITYSQTPLLDCWGAQHWSSSSKNRPSMRQRGDYIMLTPGSYGPPNRFTSDFNPADPITVIAAEVPGTVMMMPVPMGGSDNCYIEWDSKIEFRDLKFLGASRATIKSENPSSRRWNGRHPGFWDLAWYNCDVDCGYDFHNDLGPRNYLWLGHFYETGRSSIPGQYGFIWSGGTLNGPHQEHIFYFHNAQGNHLLENLTVYGAGRTFLQDVGRLSEGPRSVGDFLVQNCYVEDVCLQMGGGGSAISLHGGHDGSFHFLNVTVKLGCDPNLHARFQPNITGAFVSYHGKGIGPLKPNTREVIVEGCHFEVGEHFKGDRPVMDIGAVDTLILKDSTIISHTNSPPALQFKPGTFGKVVLYKKRNTIVGKCRWGNDMYPDFTALCDGVSSDPQAEIIV